MLRFRSRVLRFRVLGASFSRFRVLRFRDLGCFVFDLECFVFDLGCFVFEFWVLRFRVLGASFSRFGCFVFEFWVLRASVFVFECFVFETTDVCHRLVISVYTTGSLRQLRLGLVNQSIKQANTSNSNTVQTIKKDGFLKN